jgi:hypothetical protein
MQGRVGRALADPDAVGIGSLMRVQRGNPSAEWPTLSKNKRERVGHPRSTGQSKGAATRRWRKKNKKNANSKAPGAEPAPGHAPTIDAPAGTWESPDLASVLPSWVRANSRTRPGPTPPEASELSQSGLHKNAPHPTAFEPSRYGSTGPAPRARAESDL